MPFFVVFGLTVPEIEPVSTVSVVDAVGALFTQPLIGNKSGHVSHRFIIILLREEVQNGSIRLYFDAYCRYILTQPMYMLVVRS